VREDISSKRWNVAVSGPGYRFQFLSIFEIVSGDITDVHGVLLIVIVGKMVKEFVSIAFEGVISVGMICWISVFFVNLICLGCSDGSK
jgi:hypothetical protein